MGLRAGVTGISRVELGIVTVEYMGYIYKVIYYKVCEVQNRNSESQEMAYKDRNGR